MCATRLEQVIIVLIHDSHVERRFRQTFGGGQATKSSSDDDDAGMSLCCGLRHCTSLMLAHQYRYRVGIQRPHSGTSEAGFDKLCDLQRLVSEGGAQPLV